MIVYKQILLLVCLILSFARGDICRGQCHCFENVVDCREDDNIDQIPNNLDPKYTKLIIQGGSFGNNVLSAANLTRLENIVSLSLIYTKIRAIDSNAFSKMIRLQNLDLSFNSISKIHPNAFRDLSLNTLQLSDQNVPLQLAPDSFTGLRVKSLILRQNGLNELRPEVFQPILGLKELILTRNNIKTIKSNSLIKDYFDDNNRLLDMTDNPLKCDCSLDWLANRANIWSKNARDLNITCRYEEKNQYGTLTGRYITLEMASLTAKQLCPKTDIQTIEVDLDNREDYLTLKCTAVSRPNMNPEDLLERFKYTYQNGPIDIKNIFDLSPPNLSWSYFNKLGNEIVTRKKMQIRTYEMDSNMSVLDLNVTLKEELNVRNFTCRAWDNESDEQKILINLSGIQNLRKPPSLPQLKEQSSLLYSDASELGERYYLFRKQFTLIEMFGAIVGTFLVTLICLLAGSRCIQVYCREKSHSHFHFSSEPSMNSDTAKKDQTVLIGGKNYSYSGSTLTPITSSSNASNFSNMQLAMGTLPQTPHFLGGGQQNYQNFPDAKTLTMLGSGGPQTGPQITPNMMAAIWAAQQQAHQQSNSNSSGSGPYSPSTMTGHEYDIPRSLDFNALTLPKNR